MTDKDTFIDGGLLRKQRETRGWTINDMAMRACLSVKQIRQLEEGGSESFYSAAVKLTAAKKVAALLGVSMAPALDQSQFSSSTHGLSSGAAVDIQQRSSADPVSQIQSEPAESQQDTLKPAGKSQHVSWWVMGTLFAAALLLAAWLNPSEEPAVIEAAPPLQILSSEMSETASSAAGGVQDVASSASADAQMRALNAAEAASK
jgi:transcriptional regulator with XRE-family HTH domain